MSVQILHALHRIEDLGLNKYVKTHNHNVANVKNRNCAWELTPTVPFRITTFSEEEVKQDGLHTNLKKEQQKGLAKDFGSVGHSQIRLHLEIFFDFFHVYIV